MKNATLSVLSLILLTACAAPISAPIAAFSPQPSASPAPSATVTETPLPTFTPTPPSEAGYLDTMEIKVTDGVNNYEFMGQPVSVSFGIDSSVKNFSSVTMPDEVAARLGTLAYESLFAPDLKRDDAGIKEFNALRAKGPLTVTVKTFDAHANDTKPEEMTLALVGEGMEVPEGVIAINKVNFVYGFWYLNPEQGVFTVDKNTPWFVLTGAKNGMGFGMMVDKSTGEMYVFLGYSYLSKESSNISRASGGLTSASLNWLALLSRGGGLSSVKDTNADKNYGEYLMGQGYIVQ